MSCIARPASFTHLSLHGQQWRLGRRPSIGIMSAKLEAGLNN
jgi:hypothetical protein